MEPENTDDLYREKLGNFSREPDPRVWKRISDSLDRKKKRRVVPIWWALGGAAAVLLLGLFLFLPDSPGEFPNSTPVTDTQAEPPGQTDPNTPPGTDSRPGREAQPGGETQPETGSQAVTESQPAAGSRPENFPGGRTQNNLETLAGTPDIGESRNEDAARQDPSGTQSGLAPETAVAARDGNAARDGADNRGQAEGTLDARTANEIVSERDAVAAQDAAADKESETARNAVATTETMANPDNETTRETGPTREALAASEAATDRETNPEGETNLEGETNPEEKRQSLFDAIAESEVADASETRADASGKRWTIGTSLAPVYYNSFGDGSPISQNFVSNSKSGTLNFSYGVSVGYAVSDRLSVRSGLNRVDFGYNTNQVAFTSTLSGPSSASLIRTISYSENARTVVVESTARNGTPPMDNTTADVNAQTPAREGRMLQEFGYLEVPVEMEYRLVDKKLGVNLVGGMSSLFLVDNSVSLDSDGATTQIGEATNMNSVSFSTNLGLGVFYNLNRDLQLEVQPMFKYHLNTFSNTAGNFQPYSVGVYSGIRYRF